METLLRDICKAEKEKQGLTSQDIANETNIPVSTINNYFSTASKAPSVYNAGAICAVLGVSLDKYFGITPTESHEEQLDRLQRIHAEELNVTHHVASMEGRMESMQRRIKAQQTLIIIMAVVLSLILLLLSLYVVLDYRAPNVGLIQGGHTSVITWIMFLLLATGIGVIAAVLLSALHYAKKHAQLKRGD